MQRLRNKKIDMNTEKYKALDEAWAFVGGEMGRGRSKKAIVPLMNEAGFTTLKGKSWTYQTLLLEQRRRANEVARQKVENGDVEFSEYHSGLKKNESTGEGFSLQNWAEGQSKMGVSLEEMCQDLSRMGILPSLGGAWSPSLLSHELGNRMLSDGAEAEDCLSIAQPVDRAPPLEDEDTVDGIDVAWAVIEEEARKGTKKRDMVHVLNLNGMVTRRGRPWTYPVLSQEIRRRKEVGQELPVRRLILATAQQKEVSSKVSEAISRAREIFEAQILPDLKGRNLKTRKGRDWTYPVLLIEMLRRDVDPESL